MELGLQLSFANSVMASARSAHDRADRVGEQRGVGQTLRCLTMYATLLVLCVVLLFHVG